MDLLGDDANQVQPLFITLDPERDTVSLMADYVSYFHPALIGLTGSVEEIRSAARTFRIMFQRTGAEEGADYFVAHSSVIYLMDREGRYETHFPYGATVDEMVEAIAARLNSLNPKVHGVSAR